MLGKVLLCAGPFRLDLEDIKSEETKVNLKGYNKFTFSSLESFKIAYQSGHESIFDDTCVGSGFISGSTNSVMWIE